MDGGESQAHLTSKDFSVVMEVGAGLWENGSPTTPPCLTEIYSGTMIFSGMADHMVVFLLDANLLQDSYAGTQALGSWENRMTTPGLCCRIPAL